MVIEITDEMRAMAQWAQAQCDKRYANSKRGNYTQLSAEGRWYIGFLGELVFMKYLQQLYVQYRYEPEFTGRDITDFYVWAIGYTENGGKVGIDVKTASAGSHKYLMIPDAQIASHPSEVYVGVRLRMMETEGEVMGYCLKKDLKPITDLGLKVPTSGVLFDNLRPMNKMIDQCKKLMG